VNDGKTTSTEIRCDFQCGYPHEFPQNNESLLFRSAFTIRLVRPSEDFRFPCTMLRTKKKSTNFFHSVFPHDSSKRTIALPM
jgi:hypothetical protein